MPISAMTDKSERLPTGDKTGMDIPRLCMPATPDDRNVITLITRMRTRNSGNQALSAALLDYFRREWPCYRVVGLERAPAALDGFVLADGAPRDAVARFRRVARNLVALPPARAVDVGRGPSQPRLVVDKSFAARVLRRARRHVPGFDRLLASAEYRHRLGVYRRSALVIANPAGEFDPAFPGEAPVRLLLDLYIAKLCGARTAAVNHSVEITDETLREIARVVYPEFDAVVVRDEQSRHTLVDIGVPPGRICVAPDAVFTLAGQAAPAADGVPRAGMRIGLALNPRNLHVTESVAETIVRGLVERGHTVTAISNCWSVDRDLWQPLAHRLPIGLQPRDLPYQEYLKYLPRFDGIVSGRLHTNIMGMISGVPSVPVEGNVYRTEALLGGRGYPLPVVHLGSSDWISRFREAVTHLESEGANVRRGLSQYVTARAAEMSSTYAAVFRSDPGVGPEAAALAPQ